MFPIIWTCLWLSGAVQVLAKPCYQTIDGQSFPNLIDATLQDLTYGLEMGLFTSVDLVNAYLDRINEVNGTLHMVTQTNPDALSIAMELDLERAKGNITGPLHGIPVLIKGNIGTDDNLETTAGSFALLGAKLPRDSTVAAKLRKAGVIILGKANLSQWANFRSLNTSNGWSAYGGQTYAAYYPNQDPSGSSSGSAVSSSIGLAWATLGTETDGSIISPSDVNNLVGIKPTVGLTSRYLVIPISQHQDTVGPIARTVVDAAYLLQAIAGVDPNDNYTSAIPNGGVLPDYVAACSFNSLKGAKFGVPYNALELYQSYYEDSAIPVLDMFYKMLKLIEAAGATIVSSNFTALDQWANSTSELTVLEVDFRADLVNYLDQLVYNPNKINNLRQLRSFTETFPAEDFSPTSRDVGLWNQSLDLFKQSSPKFWAAYQEDLYLGGEGGLLGAIARNNLDAVLLPSQFSPGFAAIVGAPIVTVPMGFYPANTTVVTSDFGLVEEGPNIPFGLSFLGDRFTEAKLIGYAYAYEQRTKIRNKVQPYIVPNTEITQVLERRRRL